LLNIQISLEENKMLYSGKNLQEVCYSGWGEFEHDFVWSTSRYCSLLLPIERQVNSFGLQITIEPFLVERQVNFQNIQLYCNGLYVLGHTSTKREKEILFTEIHPSVSNLGSLKIDFIFNNSVSPSDLGLSTDMRSLAYKIYEFQIL
jgi:hypothetical protein